MKVARVAGDGVVQALTESFSVEHHAERLSAVLERLGRVIGADGSGHAVTMTAELSQRFRTKAEGVGFVLDALARAFPGASASGKRGAFRRELCQIRISLSLICGRPLLLREGGGRPSNR